MMTQEQMDLLVPLNAFFLSELDRSEGADRNAARQPAGTIPDGK